MIQPIKQNVTFSASQIPQVFQNVAQSKPLVTDNEKAQTQVQTQVQTQAQPQNNDLKGFAKTAHNTKNGVLNFLKGFNNIKDTASGFIRGLGDGIATGALIGTVGANYIKSKEAISETLKSNVADAKEATKAFPVGKLIFKTINGTIMDIFKAVKSVVTSIPKIYTQSPQANLKELADKKPITSFFKDYMKSGKLIAFAVITAIAITAIRTIEGKIIANVKNAKLDHALNEGHLPTK